MGNVFNSEAISAMFAFKSIYKQAPCGIKFHTVKFDFEGECCPTCIAEKEEERKMKELFETEIDNWLLKAGAGRLFVSTRKNLPIPNLDMSSSFILTGSVGVGKTFTALNHLERFLRQNRNAVYITGYDVASYSKNSFGINEFFAKIERADLLVIDEIQEIFALDNSTIFDNIVDVVYRNDGRFILTGNYMSREAFLENFSLKRYPRIVSRLEGSGLKILHLEGQDRRRRRI